MIKGNATAVKASYKHYRIILTAALMACSLNSAWATDWAQVEDQAEKSFMDGAYQDSEARFNEAITMAEKSGDRLNVANTLNQMTHLLLKQKRYEEARNGLSKAVAIRKELLGADDSKTTEAEGNLALIEHKLGNDKEAERLYKEVIAAKRAKQATSLATTLTNLANLYTEMKRIDEASVLYKEALELDQKNLGQNHKETAQDYFNLGAMYFHHLHHKEAVEYLDKALVVYIKLDDVPGQIKTYHYLGLAHAGDKSHDTAIDAYKKALALHSKLKGDNHPDTFVHQLNLARSLDHTGKSDEAERLYKNAVGAAIENHRNSKIKLVECTLEYSHFLRRHNRQTEAEQKLKEVLPAYESLSANDRRQLYELPRAYSDLLKELKQDSASDAMARKHLHVFGPTSAVHEQHHDTNLHHLKTSPSVKQ
jgi:tetratricopeptide (TPR) repeat protein